MFSFHLWWFDHAFHPCVCVYVKIKEIDVRMCAHRSTNSWRDVSKRLLRPDRGPRTDPCKDTTKPTGVEQQAVLGCFQECGWELLAETEMTQRLHYQRPAPAWLTAHKDWNPGGYCTLGEAAQRVGKSSSGISAGLTVSLASLLLVCAWGIWVLVYLFNFRDFLKPLPTIST